MDNYPYKMFVYCIFSDSVVGRLVGLHNDGYNEDELHATLYTEPTLKYFRIAKQISKHHKDFWMI